MEKEIASKLLIEIGWPQIGIGLTLIALIQWGLAEWIKSRVQNSIKHEYDRSLEEFKYDIKVREQAAKVAEYMATARDLKASDPQSEYQKVNKLAWELGMWLPSETYMKLAESIANPTKTNNPLEMVIAVRKILLKEKAGDLKSDNILHHAPNLKVRMNAPGSY